MPTKLPAFYDAFQKAMDDHVAAAFVGAGFSVPAGYVDWKTLLRGIASELELDIDSESDLIGLAQFHVNQTGSRGGINQALIDEFTRQASPTANHELLAGLPLSKVWTTNYDHLLEDAFKAARKRVDRKVNQADLARTLPKRDVVLYKMHGDIDSPETAVLVKEDYELYEERRRLFSYALQGDLVWNTFVFLGFSFNDPNVSYILGRVRSLIGENKRPHYWITRDATSVSSPVTSDIRRQRHRIADLKRYGIQTVLINSYDEVRDILSELVRRVNRKNILFSGSASDFSPFGRDRCLGLARLLANRLIEAGFNVVSGLGLGIGDAVAIGAIEAVYRAPMDHLEDRALLRPFPQGDPGDASLAALWRKYREDMVGRAGTTIFMLGNKDDHGAIVPAGGVLEEFRLGQSRGVFPIPIGATGHAAREIWNDVNSRLPEIFGSKTDGVTRAFQRLNDGTVSNEEIVAAVMEILNVVVPK